MSLEGWQGLRWKRINDLVNSTVTTLVGGYGQAGYFLHEAIEQIPSPLEFVARYARYNPNTELGDDVQQELALAANWFFQGHLNKLTTEATLFAFGETGTTRVDGWRYRLQWDVSF